MHRLAPVLLAAVMAAASACATAKVEIADPPYVEKLRIRITKVRHSIRETRQAISLSRGAPYLPELYTRLAELLSEEARYHYQVAYEREQRASQVLHAPQVRFLKEQAISTYRMVLAKYQDTPLADRILFNIGHEQRELGLYDDMIKTLEQLAAEHAKSPLRPEALLVLGDHYFDKGELDRAETYYDQIVKGAQTKVAGLAYYKLGWVWVNRTDCPKALSSFESAIDHVQAWEDAAVAARKAAAGDDEDGELAAIVAGEGDEGDDDDAPVSSQSDLDVRREALVDMMYCFASERKADTALKYLQKKAYNRATYIAALERLAGRYAVVGEAKGGMDVTRELLRLAPTDPDRLDDARLLYSAIRKAKDFKTLGRDIRLITDAMRRLVNRVDATPDMRNLTVKEFEQYTRDLCTRGQQSLNPAKGKPAGRQQALAVARGYEAYLDAFPEADARLDMVLNLADVLAETGQDLQSGLRYAEAADLMQARGLGQAAPGKPAEAKAGDAKAPAASTEQTHEGALYDAVVQFQKTLDRLADRDQVERVVVRAAMRKVGAELLEYKLAAEKARNVKLAIARTYYDEGKFHEAIDRLGAVAYEYPKTPEAKAAIHLVLDSYNTLNDYDGMIAVGHRFLAADSPADDGLKGELKPIVAAAEKRKLDELSLAAAGDEGGDLQPLKDFAAKYAGTSLGERALLNAFVAARAVGDSETLYKLGEEIATKYPKSENVPGVIATLAKNALATFDFDRAITLYRRAAEANPEQRVRLLVATGEILQQLGDADGALSAFDNAAKAAGQGPALETPTSRLAELLEIIGDDGKTVSMLTPYAGGQNPELLARLGLAQVRMGQADAAEMTLQGVIGEAAASSAEARARAQYGMAEALAKVLYGYTPQSDLDSVQEYVALVEVTEQGYLNAVRQGSPTFTPAALGRLAYMADHEAKRMAALPTPSGLAPDEAKAFKAGLKGRVQQLEGTAKEALKACAEQAWTTKVFTAPVRACLRGQLPAEDPVAFDKLKPRRTGSGSAEIEALRRKLAKNPKELVTLRKLGDLYLKAGDAHMARLVFARAAQSGGGPEDLNNLGVAAWRIGDTAGALDAFGQAADGGLEAGRLNVSAVLSKLGLGEAAKTALDKWPEGKGGGIRL